MISQYMTFEAMRDLGWITNRCYNALERANHIAIHDLLELKTPNDIRKIRGIGKKSQQELLKIIKENALWPDKWDWPTCRNCLQLQEKITELKTAKRRLLEEIAHLRSREDQSKPWGEK